MTATVKPIREGFHTITPYLVAEQPDPLIEFMKKAFGAEETLRGTGSAGGTHCEVRIGDSMLMIGGGGASVGTAAGKSRPQGLHLYMPNADAVYQRAGDGGATSLQVPTDQPYGDREAGVKDCAGNLWYIATHGDSAKPPYGLHTVTPFLHVERAGEMIDFLKAAFGAKEMFRVHMPNDTVQHARIQVGDSTLELGEAHGPFQPMPAMFYLSVEHADLWYQQAVEWGATSMFAPAEQPYGDRVGAVSDPFGNEWYIGTHVKDVPM
jgi:PhnB protein